MSEILPTDGDSGTWGNSRWFIGDSLGNYLLRLSRTESLISELTEKKNRAETPYFVFGK